MTDVVKVEWTETSQYSAFIRLPEGETFESFDKSRYDMAGLLAEHNEDIHHEGTERGDIEVYDQKPPANEEVEEPDWEMFEA